MATASITNTFVTGTPAVASEVNTNFTNLVTFLNNSVIHRDGTKTMTGSLDLGSQKIVNLANGSASGDAVNKSQLDAITVATTNISGYTSEDGLTDRGPNGTADLTAGTFNLGSNGTYRVAWKQAFGVTTFTIVITIGTGGGFGTWASGIQLPGVVGSAFSIEANGIRFDAEYYDASSARSYRGTAKSGTSGYDYLVLNYDNGTNGEQVPIATNLPFPWTASDRITITGTTFAAWAEF